MPLVNQFRRPLLDRTVYISSTPTPEPGTNDPSQDSTLKPANPGDKLLRYFPVGALTLYSGLDPLFRVGLDGDALTWSLWGALVLGVIFTLAWLIKKAKVKNKTQPFISAFIFVVYVATIGGPFTEISWWEPWYAAAVGVVVVAFITFTDAWVRADDPVVVPAN